MKTLILLFISFPVTILFLWQDAYQNENAGVFPGKCVQHATKTMVVDRKNQKALLYIWRQDCCKMLRTQTLFRLSPQQNQQQRWSPRRRIRNLNFLSSTTKTTDYSFELFFHNLIKLFLSFAVFTKTRFTMQFCAKNTGYSTGLSQVYVTSYW